MATNALPAGFSITSINGQRCTAVPRSLTTLTGSVATEAAAQPPTTTKSTSTAAGVAATSAAQGVNTVISSSAVVVLSTSTTPIQVTSILTTSSVASLTAAAASPASKGTTPTVSSSTQIPIAQSEITSSSAGHISTIDTLSTLITSKTTSRTTGTSATSTSVGAAAPETSTGGGISSSISAGPVVGGVLGSMSFIALAAFIFWFIRRRRRNRRESLLTPLTTGIRSSFYAQDPPRPDSRSEKFRTGLGYQTTRLRDAGSGLKASLAGLGAVLKRKVVRERSDTPSVNLNRGNSQFMDGPIPQHSRSNSMQSSHSQHITLKEKASDWYERLALALNIPSQRRKLEESADPFANARTMAEKKAKQTHPPDFSQLLSMGDKDLQLQAERRRNSLAAANNNGSVVVAILPPQLGSLGLNFDPFADPEPVLSSSNNRPRKNTDTRMGLNPFLDPPPPPTRRPEPSIAKPNTYISDIRRSRGQSIDATTISNNASSNQAFASRPPSTTNAEGGGEGVGSRYPSTIAPSRDSYRDTVFTTFSENARKGKGRSDPFDLERPELWRPRAESSDLYPMPLNPTLLPEQQQAQQQTQTSTTPKAQGILGIDFNGQPSKRVDTDDDDGGSSSKYSSGIYSDFGEPGPDVEPGSLDGGGSPLSRERERESEPGGYQYTANGQDIYAQQLRAQGNGNVSPMSKASSKGGVGKAM